MKHPTELHPVFLRTSHLYEPINHEAFNPISQAFNSVYIFPFWNFYLRSASQGDCLEACDGYTKYLIHTEKADYSGEGIQETIIEYCQRLGYAKILDDNFFGCNLKIEYKVEQVEFKPVIWVPDFKLRSTYSRPKK